MLYINTNSTDATWNLACEEYAFKNLSSLGPIMMLWQNNNTIVVGRYQNTNSEINIDEVNQRNVQVVRRITGGGTVYHDLGNLNYSFILPMNKEEDRDLKYLSKPLLNALENMGVKACVNGRNDITIEDKKISGTAQSIHKNNILHHGTLLFNSNLSFLGDVLKVDKEKIQSKGIKSVKSRVTNISDYIEEDYNIDKFKKLLISNLSKEKDLIEYKLNYDDMKNIKKLQEEKYKTWEWNFGNNPSYNYNKSKRFKNGKLDIRMDIEKGIIKDCKIYGDFLGVMDIDDLQSSIIGYQYKKDEIASIIDNIELKNYLGNISKEELIECIF